jgi:hypothetical protein
MPDVINLWPDPKFITSDETSILAYNYFHNPSPVDSLAGFTAAGTATLTLDPTVSIRGQGGLTVDSPDASSGVTMALSERDEYRAHNFTVYVRAHEAMTITGSATADYTLWPVTAIGWGDFGWGEAYSYVEGASYTFAAGEVKRFRICTELRRTTQGGTWPLGTPAGMRFHLKGTGTFDVDAVWHGDFVDDGIGEPGGELICDAPLYFDGASTDTVEFSYSWEGPANASRSVKTGQVPKHAKSDYSFEPGYDNARLAVLPGGEKALAFQAAWEMNTYNSLYFGIPGEYGDQNSYDLKQYGLEPGKFYVFSVDLVSTYENYIEGYVEGDWDQFYLTGDTAETGVPFSHPLRRRFHMPIIAGPDPVPVDATVYRNWATGETFLTSVSLFEVPFVAPTWSPDGSAANLPLDLLAHGLQAGSSYIATFDVQLAAGQFYRVEYQDSVGGPWITAAEALHDPDYVSEYYELAFDLPAGAVAARLSADPAQVWFDLEVFSQPPAYFDGDTPDGGGFTYSWAGLPGDSMSIQSVAGGGTPPALEAQVFTGGTAKTVTEIRVAGPGGVLATVTDMRSQEA